MADMPTMSDRAIRDAVTDRLLAAELFGAAKLAELHTLCQRLIDEREKLAQGFNAVVVGWSLIDDKGAPASGEAIAAIERIATEAIQFARDVVVQAMKPSAQGDR